MSARDEDTLGLGSQTVPLEHFNRGPEPVTEDHVAQIKAARKLAKMAVISREILDPLTRKSCIVG